MRSWSLRPPYVRVGVPSWTVAKDRACVVDGRATRARAFAEAADGAEVLDSISSVDFTVCGVRSIDRK